MTQKDKVFRLHSFKVHRATGYQIKLIFNAYNVFAGAKKLRKRM